MTLCEKALGMGLGYGAWAWGLSMAWAWGLGMGLGHGAWVWGLGMGLGHGAWLGYGLGIGLYSYCPIHLVGQLTVFSAGTGISVASLNPKLNWR